MALVITIQCGQEGCALGREMSAGALTWHLSSEALARLEVSLQDVQSEPSSQQRRFLDFE